MMGSEWLEYLYSVHLECTVFETKSPEKRLAQLDWLKRLVV
jgi:hypothetical protein